MRQCQASSLEKDQAELNFITTVLSLSQCLLVHRLVRLQQFLQTRLQSSNYKHAHRSMGPPNDGH
jgi:hypothetical protein